MFDIRIQSTIDISLPENPWGDIFILGCRHVSADRLAELRLTLAGLDRSATFCRYGLRTLEAVSEDYNIVCPIKDPAGNRMFYVVAKCEYDDIDFAVSEVIDEAESRMRKFVEEAIVVAAMQAPDLLVSVAGKVIDDRPESGFPTVALSDMIVDLNFTTSSTIKIIDRDDDIDYCAPCDEESSDSAFSPTPDRHEAALGFAKGAVRPAKPEAISAKLKKQAFSNLPKKLSAAFEKQNVRDYEIAKQTMAMFTPKENIAILEQMYRENPDIFQKYYATALSAASRYEIHVRPWKSEYRSDFKDRYLYCIYLRNAKGTECPVTFRNYPAYCIYMMYIIDRAQRGDDATDLVMKDLRKEFCQLYKTIIAETDCNISNFYDGMDYRKNEETGRVRKGRYDDYIKDIHNTLEKLVGEFDSIPLKVGHGRCLSVMPERIFMDERLTKFKLA